MDEGKYYVVGLTQDEVAKRALTQIADPIRERFLTSAKTVSEGKIGNRDKMWATIKFDADMVLNPSAKTNYPDFFEVLYLDENAKELVEKSGFKLNIIDEVSKLPENLGTFISMPFWS